MRRTSLLLGALLLAGRTVSAQTMPFYRSPAQTAVQPTKTALDAPLEVTENLTSFDNSRAELNWQDRNWKIVANGVVIKEFGRSESEARQALRLVRELGLNQHGTVGEPKPVVEYWLRDGHAPIGLASGVRSLAIDSSSLKAELSSGQWIVRDRQRVWFNFGSRGDEAQQALAIMQKYQFTQVAAIGTPTPSMMVFLGNPARPGSGPATNQPAPTRAAAPATAMTGYIPPTLPPLRSVSSQSNQPWSSFNRGPVDNLTTHSSPYPRSAPPSAAGVSERVTFDWRLAQVHQEQGRFKVMAGSHVLGDFGTNERAAAQALTAVKYYRFTEQCQVGQPAPYCSYFLVGGLSPRGIPFGLQGQPIDAAHLAVQQVGDKYALVSNGHPLMQFGPRPDEARHMLDVIQRHKFDHVCHVGGPEEQGMTFLVQAQ